MRLIDADALRSRLYAAAKGAIEEDGESAEGLFITGMLIGIYDSAIDKAPTIEAEPVRHAKWRKSQVSVPKTHEFCCTACATYVSVFAPNCYYKYCPNCGARMGGAESK